MSEQRERFEAWAKSPPREWLTDIAGPKRAWPGQYLNYHVQCAWEAWQAACPEGWQVVPKRADDSMKLEGWKVKDNPGDSMHQVWNAMLSAAPKPGDV